MWRGAFASQLQYGSGVHPVLVLAKLLPAAAGIAGLQAEIELCVLLTAQQLHHCRQLWHGSGRSWWSSSSAHRHACCCQVPYAAPSHAGHAANLLYLVPSLYAFCWFCVCCIHACRNDVVALQGSLSDYLIKVVPSWIKFAVAGPGQSTNVYNEQTLYTSPEHLMPLIRCAVAPASCTVLRSTGSAVMRSCRGCPDCAGALHCLPRLLTLQFDSCRALSDTCCTLLCQNLFATPRHSSVPLPAQLILCTPCAAPPPTPC